MTKTVRSALVATVLTMGTIHCAFGASSAQSSAFGEYVKIDVLPLLGSPVHVISGPLPSVAGSAPPAYSNGATVASATVSSGLLSTILQTGVLTVNAASGLPNASSVSADATVNNTTSAIAALLGLTADVIKSNVSVSGTCGSLTTTGTTTLVNAKLTGLLGVSLAANPLPNTLVLNSAGVKVVLNEQIPISDSVTTGLTVNAIHITLTNAVLNLGLVSGQIIISQSQGSMQCTPPSADITLTKTASPSPVKVGTDITYVLTALNHGPDSATNVVVSDTLPANITLVSATPSQGHCTGSTAISCNLGSINSGSAGTVTIVATAVSGPTITNSATVTSDVADKNPGDNTSTVTTAVTALTADLGLTTTANPSPVNTGGTITYTITVVNRGPDAAPNVTLSDTLPANATLVSISPSAGSCTTSSCNLGTINSGGSASATIVATVNSGPTVTNTATVSSDVPDKNTADNTSTVTTPVNAPTADLGIAMTGNPSPVKTGGTVTYTLTISNRGPDAAPNTTVSDALSSNLTLVSITPSTGQCNGTSCNLGTLNSGANATITVVATANAGPSVTNSATVSSSVPDKNTADNSASVTTAVTAPAADLGVTITANPSPVTAGGTITYTVTIANRGPDAATSVTLSDTLPSNETFVSVTPSSGQCSGTSAISCNLGTIASGASATVTIVATVVSGPTVTDSATAASAVADKNTADNTASVTTTVNLANADLGITKTSTPTTALNIGQNVTYTMQIANAGPGVAPNTVMTDMMPAEVTFVSVSSSQGSCSGSTTVTCSLGTIASGAGATVTIVGTANSIPNTAGRRATNTATVRSDAPDPNPANNTATASNEIH